MSTVNAGEQLQSLFTYLGEIELMRLETESQLEGIIEEKEKTLRQILHLRTVLVKQQTEKTENDNADQNMGTVGRSGVRGDGPEAEPDVAPPA
jgi:hypothetical protein